MASNIAHSRAQCTYFFAGIEGTNRFSRGNLSERVRICSLGNDSRDWNATVSSPLRVVCSTSSESRDAPGRDNTRPTNPKQRGSGSGSTKAMGILPSDMSLLRALQEHISSADLPPDQVPSTRELARSGRQDLANAVRRRGYKAVARLLANPNFIISSCDSTPSNPIEVVATSGTSTPYVLNGATSPKFVRRPDSQVSDVSSPPQTTYLIPQNGSSQLVPYYNSKMPSDSSIQRNHAASDAPVQPENFRPSIQREYEGKEKVASSHNAAVNPSTLQDWSADFLHRTAPNSNELSQVAAENSEGISDGEELYTCEDSRDHDGNDKWTGPEPSVGFLESQESAARKKAALLRAKLQSFFNSPIDSSMTQFPREPGTYYDIIAKQQETERILQQEQRDIEMLSALRTDPGSEIARLTALLHAREMEYLRVSRELEEAKALLALVRARSAADLAQAKQVAVEKDLRLHTAEQALSSMKLVQVDWWGEGNRVQLAGSFNGWEHHVYLSPDISSELLKVDSAGGPMLWGVDLWLYPGVYDIKFIVDGKWQLDHRRETVQRHMGQNNLLYVEP